MLKIDGFGITTYRSFGGDIQHVGPLAKINLLIGQNNSGKSNILRFAANHLSGIVDAARRGFQYPGFKPIDQYIGEGNPTFAFHYGLDLNSEEFDAWRTDLYHRSAPEIQRSLERLLKSELITAEGNVAWFSFERVENSRLLISPSLVRSLEEANILYPNDWANLWSALTRSGGGNLRGNLIPETLHALAPFYRPFPQIAFVPAIREIQTTKGEDSDFSGRGLIERLAKLQNPSYRDQELKKKFEAINHFLQEVTGAETGSIEIPAERDTILAHLDSRTLPLESLGTGIHEVVILAAAATSVSDHLVCMEEPEIHLHPILQRKLLTYLQNNTDNQYLIATHSAHLLDAQNVNIFHVKLKDGISTVSPAITTVDKFNVCTDLGYRASDILQANCVIWVEGPSDRIYLRHWIKQLAPELIEGAHYSLMFYGGRLLSHLTANDPEVDDFISLRRLNRFVGILIDSDKRSAHHPLNATKRRVRDEISQGSGFAWITAGREIENYVPPALLDLAIRGVHGVAGTRLVPGRFDDALLYLNSKKEQRKADKVKVASRVAQQTLPLDMLDLQVRIKEVVSFIRKANGA
jgi:hypothetical protein